MTIHYLDFTVVNGTVGFSSDGLAITRPERVKSTERVKVDVTLVSVVVGEGTGISLVLQDSFDGTTWNTASQAKAVTADGTYTIVLNPETANDLVYMPLRPLVRVAITTDEDASAVVSKAFMVQYG